MNEQRVYHKRSLYVKILPKSFDESELRDLFSVHINVKSAVILRKLHGTSLGRGVVEFYSEEDALYAKQKVNNSTPFGGLPIRVTPYYSKESVSVEPRVVTVKVSNLSTTIDETHFIQLFQDLSISSCYIQSDSLANKVAFLEFASYEDARSAVDHLRTTSIDNRYLQGEIVAATPVVTQPIYISKRGKRGKRVRPRHRNWRGRILAGNPPPCARKRFENPLPLFPLPIEYENIINSKEEILDVVVETEIKNLFNSLDLGHPSIVNGSLTKSESAKIYHNLIHGEETRMRVDIRQYDLHGVTFELLRGLFVIKVPGLAEKRPSVLRGDIVKAKLHDGITDTIYDGYAHYVNLEDVHVSFHRDIHNLVLSGCKFDVQFTFCRTPIRLFHRAVDMSVELWEKLWCAPKLDQTTRLPLKNIYGSVSLNEEQQQALLAVLYGSTSFMVLHGPPGTGKTHTLIEAILQIVNRSSIARVLVCAPSNSAVDLVGSYLLGKLPKNVTMFRLNGFMRDPKSIEPQTLLDYCYRNRGAFDIYSKPDLQNFNIILSTCVSAGYLSSMGIQNTHFSHIFVDEAGEAVEPETLIPLNLANKDTSIVLAGDHLQLGPIVRSSTALEWRYDRSLMEHLLEQYPDRFVRKLVRSYRAHPALMELYSRMFYNNQLINCADISEVASLLKWRELPNPTIPLMFVHSEGIEDREPDSPSWFNESERKIVFDLARSLLNDRSLKLTPDDIGIITPYRKQVKKIQQYAHGILRNQNAIGKVGTVENFQGQERKVIILSLVRSQSKHLAHDAKFKLGFCSNPKRLNVAISRAKALLIIVGNGTLFGSNDKYWDELLKHCKANNLFKGPVPTWHFQATTIPQHPPETRDDNNEDIAWADDYK